MTMSGWKPTISLIHPSILWSGPCPGFYGKFPQCTYQLSWLCSDFWLNLGPCGSPGNGQSPLGIGERSSPPVPSNWPRFQTATVDSKHIAWPGSLLPWNRLLLPGASEDRNPGGGVSMVVQILREIVLVHQQQGAEARHPQGITQPEQEAEYCMCP